MTNNKQEENNWEKEIHDIMQNKIANDVWYQDRGCEQRLESCLARAEIELKELFSQTLHTNNEKLREELVKPSEIRTAKSACKEEDNFDFGYDIKTKEISDLLQSNLNKENI